VELAKTDLTAAAVSFTSRPRWCGCPLFASGRHAGEVRAGPRHPRRHGQRAYLGELKPGVKLPSFPPLFPRIETEKEGLTAFTYIRYYTMKRKTIHRISTHVDIERAQRSARTGVVTLRWKS